MPSLFSLQDLRWSKFCKACSIQNAREPTRPLSRAPLMITKGCATPPAALQLARNNANDAFINCSKSEQKTASTILPNQKCPPAIQPLLSLLLPNSYTMGSPASMQAPRIVTQFMLLASLAQDRPAPSSCFAEQLASDIAWRNPNTTKFST